MPRPAAARGCGRGHRPRPHRSRRGPPAQLLVLLPPHGLPRGRKQPRNAVHDRTAAAQPRVVEHVPGRRQRQRPLVDRAGTPTAAGRCRAHGHGRGRPDQERQHRYGRRDRARGHGHDRRRGDHAQQPSRWRDRNRDRDGGRAPYSEQGRCGPARPGKPARPPLTARSPSCRRSGPRHRRVHGPASGSAGRVRRVRRARWPGGAPGGQAVRPFLRAVAIFTTRSACMRAAVRVVSSTGLLPWASTWEVP